MYDAKSLLKFNAERKAARLTFETQWRDIAKLLRLLRDDFGRKPIPGEKRGEMVYDSTPIYAADNLTAGIYGTMTNSANIWFTMATEDDDLNRYQSVRKWLDTVSARMLASFGPAISNFYNSVPQLFGDVTSFGTGAFYSAEVPGTGRIQDVTRPLSEIYISTNQFDEVDTLDRNFEWSARAIAQRFGMSNLPTKIVDALEKNPDMKFPMVHFTLPNEDFRRGALGPKGKAFLSVYVTEEGNTTLGEFGYHEFPYMVPRWAVAAGEDYGRGPAMNAMPDIKMLQAMNRTLIQAAERQANPPLLAPNEGVISVMRTVPGKVTYGGVSRNGSKLVQELGNGGSTPIALEMIDKVREQIKDAFYFSIMQMIGRTGMTATEVVTRQEEKMRLMGPHQGRIESEFLTPLIRRRFNMLMRAGSFPPPPPELQKRNITVRYESPMAKAQKSAEGAATLRFLEGAQAFAAINSTVLNRINGAEGLRVLQDAFGAPARILYSDEEYQQRQANSAQAQQVAGGLAAGEQGANIVAKLASAAKAGGMVPAVGGRG